MNHGDHHERSDHEFDSAAREQYRRAADQLPPSLQGRLRAARRTALAGEPKQRKYGLRLAAAMTAAVFALAIGLRLQDPVGQPPTQNPPTQNQAPDVTADRVSTDPEPDRLAHDDEAPELMLDEDPDFYLWLGEDGLPATLEQSNDPT